MGRLEMEQKIKRDGHIHTPFCPHGSKDSLEAYVEEAICLGREEISFTEHFPLPKHIIDPIFAEECALDESVIPEYFKAIESVKEKYKGRIKINKGFEVDYIEGKEEEIKALLNQYGKDIEDSILSVHFVYYEGVYYAIDYKSDVERLLERLPSVEMMYDLYFKTLIKSIEADLGKYKPKRIGHPSLVRIFQKKWSLEYENDKLYEIKAQKMKKGCYEIDFNVAGLRKELCGETYPVGKLLEILKQYEIPYIYGSDAHEVSQMALLDKL